MRRLYESSAVRRDDDDQFTPNERDRETTPRALRSLPGNWLSRRLVPNWLRYRAISVDITTEQSVYPTETSIPFRVTMKNALPIPVDVPTVSPVLWCWSVDGHTEASHVPTRDPPEEQHAFHFDRGEQKQFTKRWDGRFRLSDSEWEPADPGEYTLGVRLNVDGASSLGLADETTVRLDGGSN
ncbi:hypothetical protein [Halovenus marina]|uniref:hypothetical protein n=1 Tax=Halovenus marina TaxID=3396621 RepID=UPI003F56A8D9